MPLPHITHTDLTGTQISTALDSSPGVALLDSLTVSTLQATVTARSTARQCCRRTALLCRRATRQQDTAAGLIDNMAVFTPSLSRARRYTWPIRGQREKQGGWRRAEQRIGPRQDSKNMGRQHGSSAPKIASREQKKSVPGRNGVYLGLAQDRILRTWDVNLVDRRPKLRPASKKSDPGRNGEYL
eukprot:gene24538-biopygen13456